MRLVELRQEASRQPRPGEMILRALKRHTTPCWHSQIQLESAIYVMSNNPDMSCKTCEHPGKSKRFRREESHLHRKNPCETQASPYWLFLRPMQILISAARSVWILSELMFPGHAWELEATQAGVSDGCRFVVTKAYPEPAPRELEAAPPVANEGTRWEEWPWFCESWRSDRA